MCSTVTLLLPVARGERAHTHTRPHVRPHRHAQTDTHTESVSLILLIWGGVTDLITPTTDMLKLILDWIFFSVFYCVSVTNLDPDPDPGPAVPSLCLSGSFTSCLQ